MAQKHQFRVAKKDFWRAQKPSGIRSPEPRLFKVADQDQFKNLEKAVPTRGGQTVPPSPLVVPGFGAG